MALLVGKGKPDTEDGAQANEKANSAQGSAETPKP